MLILSKRTNHKAKKNVFDNEKSFLSTSTAYPLTSRLKTESPQLLTERTKTSYYQTNNKNTIEDKQIVFSKTINFQTIKKKIIFNKNSIKRHLQDQKEKLYRSLDAHDNTRNNSKQAINIKPSIQKNIKLKAHIQMKNSNSVQGFFKSKIKAYGISTFKGQKNIMNNHFMSVHLGKVKQFLLIQNLDGFSTGTLVKKQLPIQVLKYYLENSNKSSQKNHNDINYNHYKNTSDREFKKLESSVQKAFEQTNNKIVENQTEMHDNSGCFVSGIFITQTQILAANCGTSSVFYFTKQEKIKQLGSIHNTFNMKELQRITKNRGKIYQTQFNLKFKTQMGIKGPIRVYPNGTTYTRIIGKTFDKIVKKSLNPQDQDVYVDSPILSQPQLSHAKVDDVQWIVMLSSGIAQFLGKTLICSIILYQISKYGLTFTVHDLAGQCSKSIINQAIIRGFQQTMSVEVIILNLNTGRLNLYEELQHKSQIKKHNEQKLKRQPQSLKYIGKRKNFVADFKK